MTTILENKTGVGAVAVAGQAASADKMLSAMEVALRRRAVGEPANILRFAGDEPVFTTFAQGDVNIKVRQSVPMGWQPGDSIATDGVCREHNGNTKFSVVVFYEDGRVCDSARQEMFRALCGRKPNAATIASFGFEDVTWKIEQQEFRVIPEHYEEITRIEDKHCWLAVDAGTIGSRHVLSNKTNFRLWLPKNWGPESFGGPILAVTGELSATHPVHGHVIYAPGAIYGHTYPRAYDTLQKMVARVKD